MALNYTLPLRIVQVTLAIIVLGLISYFVSKFWDAPSSSEFLLFTSVWTILALFYLIITPARFPYWAHKFAILAVELLTAIFWFCGWIALAAWLGDWCGGGSVCGAGKAATVFAAFEWVAFCVTAVMAVLHVHRTRGTHNNTPPPQMQEGV